MRSALHYLYLSSRGLSAAREQGAGLAPTGSFEPPGEDAAHPARQGFDALLRAHPADEFVLLVDVVDEEQHIERIPRLRYHDRKLLLARRLEQKFRDGRFATWISLERNDGWRWRNRAQRSEPQPVLLTALHGDAALQPWLGILVSNRARIAGIYSPSLLAAPLVERIRENGSGLLVTLQPGGLRQTLVIEGQTRFSRLAAVGQLLDAAGVSAECTRTLQYLLMAQTLSRDMLRAGEIKLWLIADGLGSAEQMRASLPVDNSASIEVQMLSAQSLGARPLAGSGTATAVLGAMPLWCQPALWRKRGGGYANPALRLYDTMARRGNQIRQLGAAGVAASLIGLCGVETLSAMRPMLSPAEETMARRNQVEQLQLERELARYPASGAEMRNVVEVSERLRQRHVDAGELLSLISQALASDDRLMLREITWSRGGEAADAGGESASSSSSGAAANAPNGTQGANSNGGAPASGAAKFGDAPVAVVNRGAAGGMAGGTLALAAGSTGVPPVLVRIRGGVGPGVSMADANRRADAFAQRLHSACGCEASVKVLPFDPAPANGYAGSLKPSEQQRAAQFAIEVIWDRAAGSVLVGGSDGRQG